MAITSSVLAQNGAESDGRRWTRETHTDSQGLTYVYSYLAAAGLDASAVMAARAVTLAAELKAAEISANVAQVVAFGSEASLLLNWSTAAEGRSALREAYQSATRLQAVMIGDFLAGLTNGQLQTLFGLTAGQVTTLRTNRLTPAANTASAIRTAVGQ